MLSAGCLPVLPPRSIHMTLCMSGEGQIHVSRVWSHSKGGDLPGVGMPKSRSEYESKMRR